MELNIFTRLVFERERLRFNKAEMAAVGGVAQPTYLRYETGDRVPDGEFYARIATHGADVLYILTGKRSQAVAEIALLHPDERSLVESYQRCRPDAKKTLLQTAALLAAGAAPEAKVSMKAGKKSMQAGTINVKGSVQF